MYRDSLSNFDMSRDSHKSLGSDEQVGRQSGHGLIQITILLLFFVLAISVILYLGYERFGLEKINFIAEMNEKLLSTEVNHVNSQFSFRMTGLGQLIPKVLDPIAAPAATEPPKKDATRTDPFAHDTRYLEQEILGIAILERSDPQTLKVVGRFQNDKLIHQERLPDNILGRVYDQHPLPLDKFFLSPTAQLINRSLHLTGNSKNEYLSILTLLVSGRQILKTDRNLVISVDFLPTFLQGEANSVHRSDRTSRVLVLTREGTILSAKGSSVTPGSAESPDSFDNTSVAKQADHQIPFPITPFLVDGRSPKRGIEIDISNQRHLISFQRTQFSEVFTVVDTSEQNPDLFLKVLSQSPVLYFFPALALVLTALIPVLIRRILKKCRRLRARMAEQETIAPEEGTPNKVKSEIRIGDIGKASRARSKELVKLGKQLISLTRASNGERTNRKELKSIHRIRHKQAGMEPRAVENLEWNRLYRQHTQNGGDFWGATEHDGAFTFFVGNVSSHETTPAISNGALRLCLCVLPRIIAADSPRPDKTLTELNELFFNAFDGKIGVSLCLSRLELETGSLVVSSCGNSNTARLRRKPISEHTDRTDNNPVEFNCLSIPRGKHLGMADESTYTISTHQLEPGDLVVCCTGDVFQSKVGGNVENAVTQMIRQVSGCGEKTLRQTKSEVMEKLDRNPTAYNMENDLTLLFLRWQTESTITHEVNLVPEVAPSPELNKLADEESAMAEQDHLIFDFPSIAEEPDQRQELIYDGMFFDNEGDNAARKKVAQKR